MALSSQTNSRQHSSERGMTLLELIIAAYILLILASAALPVFRFTVVRQKEAELRRDLREIRSASIFVADYLPPAAKKAGAHIEDGQRFGLHNLRHSLRNWLVNKAKVEPKTVQGILRHARVQTTLDLYTQEDIDETLAAHGESLTALGVGSYMVQ